MESLDGGEQGAGDAVGKLCSSDSFNLILVKFLSARAGTKYKVALGRGVWLALL